MRRASTRESWSQTTTICLPSAKSIPTIPFSTDTQPTQPGQPYVAVTVATRDAANVAHQRPPICDETPSPTAHQQDVPLSCIDTQHVYLCREVRGAPKRSVGANAPHPSHNIWAGVQHLVARARRSNCRAGTRWAVHNAVSNRCFGKVAARRGDLWGRVQAHLRPRSQRHHRHACRGAEES
jgi:hypothetical protein